MLANAFVFATIVISREGGVHYKSIGTGFGHFSAEETSSAQR